ncbi:Uncharacterised protein [Vibrio cholerae]|nr:Uncharacterised protein [Vibrio cholerae]CSC80885.1 Uncharacterised protein [Vibrio cholerae]CSI01553.1 Uncharacterised protein [Vibrio cholerae]
MLQAIIRNDDIDPVLKQRFYRLAAYRIDRYRRFGTLKNEFRLITAMLSWRLLIHHERIAGRFSAITT